MGTIIVFVTMALILFADGISRLARRWLNVLPSSSILTIALLNIIFSSLSTLYCVDFNCLFDNDELGYFNAANKSSIIVMVALEVVICGTLQ